MFHSILKHHFISRSIAACTVVAALGAVGCTQTEYGGTKNRVISLDSYPRGATAYLYDNSEWLREFHGMSDAQISERLSDEAASHHSVGMTPVQVRVKPNETVFAAWRAGVWRFTKFTATQSKMVVTLNFADATTQPTSTTKPTSPAKAAVMR